jgi:hypothetical protein
MAKSSKSAMPDVELVPDAWAKFEKFVKGIVKAGPQHRPPAKVKKPVSKRTKAKP